MKSNCLPPAPNTPKTMARMIANAPYKRGLFSES